ncbi:MAG: lipoyl(octanoyl) transferase LipB, partial [Bacteroidales bacterium]|nr:lipoyl(octanoyl) transferase LipB [Bacteroidales bacterium]
MKDYGETWTYQKTIFDRLVNRKFDISNGVIQDTEEIPGTLIFVEHPHVYTLGKSGKDANLLISQEQLYKINAQLYHIDRGGDITYHGPGQIVGYPIFDLEKIHIGLKEYIYRIEEAIILSLKEIGIEASRYSGGTGVWLDVDVPSKTRKICAIGVRSSRYVTMHGFALNVNTD